jgi:cell division protein FtsL
MVVLKGFIAVILSILVVFIAPAYAQNQTRAPTEQELQEQNAKQELQQEVRNTILQELNYQQLLLNRLEESQTVLQKLFNSSMVNITRPSVESLPNSIN